ncbi:uncharacterized protein A4U43_C10F350 [Asparagus officinalis]|uniref:S-acyltransferase n=1 Tax=Asparagus officinalis TaxID=4686 RepID=A0A5P1DZJ1_ASPOF|nr:probable protein S-acyltransferase 12 [Asparagus officinalis]ONK55724.1 uncharacterized protein A4U43_C10F350 [Asparagus officinalis]
MDCCFRTNPFRLCSGLKVLGSYYAVVFVVWGPKLLDGDALAYCIIITFNILLILASWSYFMVVFRDPGTVPLNWRPTFDEESLETGSSMMSDYVTPESRASTWTSEGMERRPGVGYCNRCQNSKPPRCHHCSICQRCVLKMDHHCVWVVNCVGAGNYKFFLLFLLYTFLETILDTLALLPHFIKFFGDATSHSGSSGNLAVTFVAFILNLAFALSLLCFLIMHTSLLFSNTTTIEVHEKKKGVIWKYDLGKWKNFEQVFGTKRLLWFLPMISKEDLENIPALKGLDFPVRSDAES